MRTIPVALQQHYELGTTTVAWALEITRTDAEVFRFTSLDRDSVIGGQTFTSSQGLTASEIAASAGLAVDNLEITTLDDGSLFTHTEVLQGKWRNASFRLLRYNWAVDPIVEASHCEVVRRGTIGEIALRDGVLVIELRDIAQMLQQPVGMVSTKTCRAHFGSTTGIHKCLKDLTGLTHTGTVTSVSSLTQFTASAMAQAANYFKEGIITWTTGANAGVSQKVRAYGAGGVFTFVLPMVEAIQVGDTFSAVKGCVKTLVACIENDNVLNFQGEPHRPLVDALMKPAAPA